MRCVLRGSSSVVEHCLAKAGVAGSNPVSRSYFVRLLFSPQERTGRTFYRSKITETVGIQKT